MGLVDDLGAPHRLLGRVEALLTRIERADRVALMATKRLLRPDTPREAHTRRVRGALGRPARLPFRHER